MHKYNANDKCGNEKYNSRGLQNDNHRIKIGFVEDLAFRNTIFLRELERKLRFSCFNCIKRSSQKCFNC